MEKTVLFKFILQAVAVAFAASVIPKKKIKKKQAFVLGLTSAVVFLLLDILSPTVKILDEGFSDSDQNLHKKMIKNRNRNQKMDSMHKKMINNHLYRIQHTGGSIHETPVTEFENELVGIEGFSDEFRTNKMRELNEFGTPDVRKFLSEN